MARQIFQVQAKDGIVRLNDFPTVNALQSLDWEPTMNEEYTSELGNSAYAGQSIEPEVTGSFQSNATGNTVSVMNRMLAQYDGAGEFTGYAFDDANPNTGTIRQEDLEDIVADIMDHKKPNEIFSRTALLPRCQLAQYNMSASVDGSATETFDFEGELAQVYLSPWHDVRSVVGTRVDSTNVDVDADYTADIGGTEEWEILGLLIDNVFIDPTDLTADNATSPTTITVSGGNTVPEGARIQVILAKVTPGQFPTIYNPTNEFAMRASDIDIFLVDKADVDLSGLADGALNSETFTDTDLFLRVQNMDLSIDMRREALRQIRRNDRNSSIYYRAATYPLNVTASITAFETDLGTWAKLQEKPTEMTDPFDPTEVLTVGDFEGKEWQIVTRMYASDGQVLQTTAFLDAFVAGRGSSVQVEGRAEVSWEFTGSAVVFEGSDPA